MRVKRDLGVAASTHCADAEALARQANKLGKLSLKVTAGDETETIDP